MTTCAVGLAQLDDIDAAVANRQSYFDAYKAKLDDFGYIPKFNNLAPWQSVPFLLKSRAQADLFQKACAEQGVEIRRYYRPSLSKLTLVETQLDCSVSEDLADRMCTLPVRADDDVSKRNDIIGRVVKAAIECCA